MQNFKRPQRFLEAIEEINICAISGAVGNYANIDPPVEQHVAKVRHESRNNFNSNNSRSSRSIF